MQTVEAQTPPGHTSAQPDVSRRRDRFHARTALWQVSDLKRVRDCGRVSVVKGGHVGLKLNNGRAGLSGLATCGSVWACPVCSAKIAASRQADIVDAVTSWERQGGRVVFGTFTMRHRAEDSLTALWDGCSGAWGAARSGRQWRKETEAHGIAGWLRLVEVTHGANGWHVHVHALLFVAGTSAPGWNIDDLGTSMFARWSRWLREHNYRTPLLHHGGLDWRILGGQLGGIGDYFTKGVYRSSADQAGLEVARGDLKDGRNGNRTPFRVLADLVDQGDAADLDIWTEWEQGSRGRRQLTWSRGLRELVGLDQAEKTDEEIAEEDHGGTLELLLPNDTRKVVCWVWPTVLELLEVGGVDAVTAWLRERDLAWLPPEAKTERRLSVS